MSSALAIAGVSAVLRDLLNDGLINHAATDSLGATIDVSVGPPDRVIPANSSEEKTQLNLFMYQVTPNTGWRNEGLPSRDGAGSQRLTNAPLAINLHYLISAHASEDFHGEILLGYAMQFLHETPVLSRKAIQKALSPLPTSIVGGATLKPAMKALENSGLENQIEQIKITPEYLNTEEMSKLWTATQSHLRPAAAYMASVVLIQAKEPVRKSLPVLMRGSADQGVSIQLGGSPTLQSVSMILSDDAGRKPEPPSWPSAQWGLRLTFHGEQLGGEKVSLRFEHPAMPVKEAVIPQSDRNSTAISFNLPPVADATWAAGMYSVTAVLENNGTIRRSNTQPLLFASRITSFPGGSSVARTPAPDHIATLQVQCSPALPIDSNKVGNVWKLTLKQKVSLLLAGIEVDAEPLADSSVAPPTAIDTITFVLKKAPALTNEIARLRVDGVDSFAFKRTVPPAPAGLVIDTSLMVTIT
jgi:hypothetical protein